MHTEITNITKELEERIKARREATKLMKQMFEEQLAARKYRNLKSEIDEQNDDRTSEFFKK